MLVLLVENNNLNQSESLFLSLEKQGHRVWLAHTPETVTERTTSLWPNLIVFHPVHGQLDMVVLQEAVNQTKLDIPRIVVGAKNHGALVKDNLIIVAPDKPQQLDQCINKAAAKQKGRFLRLPGLIVDCEQLNVLRNEETYSLTPKEFKLLHLLIDNHSQILSRKTIMQKVWDTDYMGDTRTLDVHIRWLREKIEENPSRPQRLITVRGLGYRLMIAPEPE